MIQFTAFARHARTILLFNNKKKLIAAEPRQYLSNAAKTLNFKMCT